jgi:uncharacterized protein (TIGR03437 family)
MRLVFVIMSGLAASVCGLAQTPVVTDNGVLNAASFAQGQPVSQGSLVSIFGSELAASVAQADSIPLSTSLSNVSVTFNGVAAPLLFISPGQINAQLPWDTLAAGTTTGAVNVVVKRGSNTSTPKQVMIGPASPGIFAASNRAIAINSDGTLAQPAGSITGLTTHPAKPGDVLIVLGTGLGAVDSPIGNGQASLDKLRNLVTPPVVLIGNAPATVLFAGLSPQFVSVNQVNLTVSASSPTGDALPIQFQLAGLTSTDKTTVAIQKP